MRFLKKTNPISVTILISLLAAIIGWQAGHLDYKFKWENYRPQVSFSNEQPPTEASNVDFKLFWDVWKRVADTYVDKKAIDAQKMYYGAIQGMVSAVGDPYTVFLPPAQQKSTQEELGGSFEGVGMELGFNKDKRLVVIAPLKDTPAAKAGILAGDMLVRINDEDATALSVLGAVEKIRGAKGTPVKVEIYREGEDKTREISMVRDTIIVKSVEFEEKKTPNGKKVAYIQLSRFGERTFEEWSEAVSNTLASGAQGVVLDVRNNPGGFLDGARFIGSEFVDNSVIYQIEDANGKRQSFTTNRPGKLQKLPLVILMNKGSASASEIVSGAMQDLKRAKLVGDQSFGKGTVQESIELPGGTGLHITTNKWLTPDGRWIHTTGLTPDEKVEIDKNDPTKDPQLDKALQLLENPQ